MVLCVLKDVSNNILNVRQLGCIVREHLDSTSWTHSILHPMLFDSFELCNMCPYTCDGLGSDMECMYAFFQNFKPNISVSMDPCDKAHGVDP